MVQGFASVFHCPNCGCELHSIEFKIDGAVVSVVKCSRCGEDLEILMDPFFKKLYIQTKRVH